MPDKVKRKKLLVQKKVQFKLIRYFLAFVFFFVIVNTLGLYLGINETLKKEFSQDVFRKQLEVLAKLKVVEESPEFKAAGFDMSLFQNPDTLINYQKRLLANILSTTNYILLSGLVFFIPLLAAFALIISHRLFGPMTRIQRSIHRISDGDLTEDIRLRKKDEMHALVNDISSMTVSLRERIRELRDKSARLERTLRTVQSQMGQSRENPAQLLLLNNCLGQLEELGKCLSSFRLDSTDKPNV